MTEVCKLKTHRASDVNQQKFEIDFAEMPVFTASPFQPVGESGAELATQDLPNRIRLDLENLKCYEVVDRQFQGWGVTFSNAVALHPSNPAFPPRSGTMVLMGAPKSGWVEATFMRPVRFVSGFVTSSRSTVMAAFDSNNQPIGQAKSDGANLAGSSSDVSPNVQLSLSGENIHRVKFYTFDGQLTLDDFSFGF